ncbi:MAG TPA: hypothetical protein VEH81_03980 [Ktedonobacteraceae bacterium]|nr:hypothetical protein [Ktedonobacteraceae bacterium]
MMSQQVHTTLPREESSAEMKSSVSLEKVKRIGTAVVFIVFPLLWVFAFAVHPGLLNPHRLTVPEEILRAHGNALLAFGHVLVLFDAALLIVVTLHFMKLLKHGWVAWAGFIGAALTVLGAIALAAEKGAESLTISALDTLPQHTFAQMMPGLVAIFSHQGAMVVVSGVYLIAIGLSIQAIALFASNVIPRWQSVFLLISFWLMGWGDGGEEIISLCGAILLAAALVPYGIQLIRNKTLKSGASEARNAT